jgi:hypothetical protein
MLTTASLVSLLWIVRKVGYIRASSPFVSLMPPPHLTLAKPKTSFLKPGLHTIDII